MRSFMVGTMVAMVVGTMAATVSADQTAAKVTTRPRIELAPAVRITGFGRPTGQTAPYTGGALALAVDVENTGSKTAEGIAVKLLIGDQTLESTVSVPARGKRVVLFTDEGGLASSCAPKSYTMTLSGAGTNAVVREGHVTPTCAFSTSIEQTWNKMSPDAVEAQKAGTAYLASASVATAPTCSAGPTLKARIVNRSASSSPSLVVQAKEWSATGTVVAQTAAAFPLASNEQKDLLLTPVGGAEVPAKMTLAIVDWTKSLHGHTSGGGIIVNTTRSCALDVGLE